MLRKNYYVEKYLDKEWGNHIGWFDCKWLKEVEAESRDNNKSKSRTRKGHLRFNHLIKKTFNRSGSSNFACFEIAFGMRRQ